MPSGNKWPNSINLKKRKGTATAVPFDFNDDAVK